MSTICINKCLDSISDINVSKLGLKMTVYKMAATLKNMFGDFGYFFLQKAFFSDSLKSMLFES